jgi:protein phosphatase
VREQNQDRFLVGEFPDGAILLAVADGAGGEAEGERAAEIVRESLTSFDPHSTDIAAQLVESMHAADQKIIEIVTGRPELKGMGTTMTAAFFREGTVHWAHVGDSRLYLFRGGKLVQITEDDTMAGFLLTEGEITREEARVHQGRNMLFECIGCGEFEAKIGSLVTRKGDLVLLTTDGLHDKIKEETMLAVLRTEAELRDKLEALVSAALEAGGKDNATVVGMEV